MSNSSTRRQRQELLTPHTYTSHGTNTAIILEKGVTLHTEQQTAELLIKLSYLPDTHLISTDEYSQYLEEISKHTWLQPEEMLTELACDIYDLAIPFYINVKGTLTTSGISQTIEVSRSQPSYTHK